MDRNRLGFRCSAQRETRYARLPALQARHSPRVNDPYICESQIITGNVKYTGEKSNLNPVVLKIKNFNANQNSYKSEVTVDNKGNYQVDVQKVQPGNYQVEYSVTDKLGNMANGNYTFEKKDVCGDSNQATKDSQLSQSQTNNLNLPRTGSNTSSFVYALMILLSVMFIGSQIPLITVKPSFKR